MCDSQEELPKGYQEASPWVQAAAARLQQHAQGVPLITEERALGHDFGPFDFAVLVRSESGEFRKVYVDVDAETHEEQCLDVGAQLQRERDR